MTMRRLLAMAIIISAGLIGAPVHAAQVETTAHYEGTLPNGATWIADVPATWNRTILLYSHGYNPFPANPARNAPDPATHAALLAQGYALAGSSYSRPGWVTDTAAQDGLDTMQAVTALIGRPQHSIAFGTSFGGLITAQLAERGGPKLDGALATCGLIGGGIDLHNYQLDGAHAIAQLLLPGQPLKLARFADFADANAAADQMISALQQAQATPQGRARVALVTALYQEPGWAPGLPKPAPHDFEAQQAGQYSNLLGVLRFTLLGRFDVEQVAGGNPSWNTGVDYRRQLGESGHMSQVAYLYRQAGLELHTDLELLNRTADLAPDPAALGWMARTSTVNGRLDMPVLTLHTIADGLVPVQHTEEYAEDVRQAGAGGLLRQAYTDQVGHCAFSTAELVAAVETIRKRVEIGRWDNLAKPERMQSLAESFGLGPAAFISFRPEEFLGDHAAPRR